MTPDLDMLRTIFARGLVSGIGSEQATCIEGAISLAMGEGLSDTPSCVGAPDRAWAIGINDAAWSSPEARAGALLPIALAQVGTAGTDRTAWARAVVEGTIRRVLPLALRAAADVHPDPAHQAALREAADRCEVEGPAAAADDAAAAAAAAAAYADDAAAAAAAAAAYAAGAARASAYASAYAAAAAAAARASAYAAAADAAADDADDAARDSILRVAVEVALDAYRTTSPQVSP